MKLANILFLVGALTLLNACDLFKKKGPDPLPGKRISVIVDSADTEVDPSADKEPLKLPAPYLNDFWLQPGALPVHAPQHLQLNKDFKEFMRYSIGSGGSDEQKLRVQPILIENNIISVDNEYRVKSFDITKKKVVWSKKLANADKEGNQFGGGIAFNAGKIYISTGFARVYSLNIDTGETLWEVALPAPSRAAPSVFGEYVIVPTIDNYITAYSSADGKRIWSYQSSQESAGFLGGANPAIAQGMVLAGFSSGEVAALRINNGQLRWNDNLSGGIQIDASASFAEINAPIVVDNNTAFVVGNANRMVAFNLKTGGRIWTRKIGSNNMPWLAGQYLFVLTNNAKLLALNTDDGKPLWASQLPIWQDSKEKREQFSWVGPVLAGGQLMVFNQDGLMKIFNPSTGALITEKKLGEPVLIPPIVANGQMFILFDNGDLVGYK